MGPRYGPARSSVGVYVTLTPEQPARRLDQVSEDWRPLFARGPALGLRKGELFALRKSDVDLERGTITVARSHDRDTTKSSAAAVLPLPSSLLPRIEHQLAPAPGSLKQRGRMLWPRAIKLPMRFHDLRHLFATEMLRSSDMRGHDRHLRALAR